MIIFRFTWLFLLFRGNCAIIIKTQMKVVALGISVVFKTTQYIYMPTSSSICTFDRGEWPAAKLDVYCLLLKLICRQKERVLCFNIG